MNPENIEPHKFKPGDPSPNPSGRPKGSRNRATIVREWLESTESIKNPISGERQTLDQQDIIVLALIKEARKGNVAAFKELMDSAHGKVTEKIEQSGGIKIQFADPTDYIYPSQDQGDSGIPESL